jgi:hypothetical protein
MAHPANCKELDIAITVLKRAICIPAMFRIYSYGKALGILKHYSCSAGRLMNGSGSRLGTWPKNCELMGITIEWKAIRSLAVAL